MLTQDAVAELAYPAAEIAQNAFIVAGDHLDAARIAAVGAAHRKGQCIVDKGVDCFRSVEGPPARREQRITDFASNEVLAQRRRQ